MVKIQFQYFAKKLKIEIAHLLLRLELRSKVLLTPLNALLLQMINCGEKEKTASWQSRYCDEKVLINTNCS